MSEYSQLYIELLCNAVWQEADDSLQNQQVAPWLFEPFSMTKRLKMHCNRLSVDLLAIKQIAGVRLSGDEKVLLGEVNCLARDVVLKGDGVAWIGARTLLPLSTLTGQEQDIAGLGETPLGERVFSESNTSRDAYNVALCPFFDRSLFARRSRLWINNKPILVSELFLLYSPLYREGCD